MKFYTDYNKLYYERKYFSKRHVVRYVKFMLKDRAKLKWLDIGCGLGYLVKELIEEGIDVYGIEISEYALKDSLVKERIKYGSITNIPFHNNSFDVISAFDVLEHIHPRDTLRAIHEVHRVLKSGGIFIMTTPNPCYFGDWIYDLTHINVRPPKYWKMILENQGFKVKMKYVPSFLKYYIIYKFKYPSLRRFIEPISDKLVFKLEEPLRYILGRLFSRRGRLYILAIKLR